MNYCLYIIQTERLIIKHCKNSVYGIPDLQYSMRLNVYARYTFPQPKRSLCLSDAHTFIFAMSIFADVTQGLFLLPGLVSLGGHELLLHQPGHVRMAEHELEVRHRELAPCLVQEMLAQVSLVKTLELD